MTTRMQDNIASWYQNALGRAPDQDGMTYWRGQPGAFTQEKALWDRFLAEAQGNSEPYTGWTPAFGTPGEAPAANVAYRNANPAGTFDERTNTLMRLERENRRIAEMKSRGLGDYQKSVSDGRNVRPGGLSAYVDQGRIDRMVDQTDRLGNQLKR
jgi:hypothetical protein